MYLYHSKTCIELNSHSSEIIWKSFHTQKRQKKKLPSCWQGVPYLLFRELATLPLGLFIHTTEVKCCSVVVF